MSNQIVLQLDPRRGNSRNSEGAFITLDSGRIIFAYTKFLMDSGDDANAVIASRYSDDGGLTWSGKDRVIVQQEGEQNVMSVSLLRLQNGRIALLYLRKDPGKCMPLLRFSDDEAKTFSEPVAIIPSDDYHVVNNDRMIQLKSGRLLVPVGLHRMRGLSEPAETSTPNTELAGGSLIFCYLSDDNGLHWYESRNANYPFFPNGAGLQEPGIVELKNGKLWGWARADAHDLPAKYACQWLMSSADGGLNWSEAKPSRFASPCSPMSVKRIPSTGHLLAIWNDHSGHFAVPKSTENSWGRTPFASAISEDEGKSWKHHRIIEGAPDHGYCYTAIHFVDDSVLLAYCAGGASSKLVLDTLRIRRMPITELYS